jgi:transposase
VVRHRRAHFRKKSPVVRDDQWERINDFLPGREGHVGGNAADNRLFVDAVLYRYRTGVPWRDLPARFGDWKIVHQRATGWILVRVKKRESTPRVVSREGVI